MATCSTGAVNILSHPYREKCPRPAEDWVPADWQDALRGPSARRSVWMALATLTCTLGYPAIVQCFFDPHGPGVNGEMAVDCFVDGGLVVASFFAFAAAVTWVRR